MKNLEIYLNSNCSLKCSYCSIYGSQDIDSKPRLEYLRKIEPEVKDIYILGGEPLECDYLDSVLDIFKNHNIFVYTNGTKYIDLDSSINVIASYHSKFDLIKFINNIKHHKKISVIVMIESESLKYLDYYKKLKVFFKNVMIDPIFTISNNKMNLKIFDFVKQNNLISKTRILNKKNKFLNLDFYYLFKIIDQPKLCKTESRYYNFVKNKEYKCLTYDILNKPDSSSDYCDSKICLCDLEGIYKIL